MHKTAGGILLVAVLAANALGQPPAIPAVPAAVTAGAPERTVLIYLPQQLFNEQEFEPALRRLSLAGIETRLAAADSGVAVSMSQLVVGLDLALRDVGVADYAGLVLIGGSGAAVHWDDSLLQATCREFTNSGKVVAAIGIAPVTLARAGVLKGRRATAFRDRTTVDWLRQAGAKYSFKGVVADGNFITAASSGQAQAFGQAVADAVQKAQ
ncbi:DJ-1/PfpI family protein [candidate division WOR-3 bacterium]|uniref:DJ-1/PfpI family protein n=1 Tax=candidate division WOR-3 bacterium TaxID=2052148 RepID=A0A938BU67_UNCW3|nr:DJ-1/PfpI family protein [candidate division WOR-3 bacterium]